MINVAFQFERAMIRFKRKGNRKWKGCRGAFKYLRKNDFDLNPNHLHRGKCHGKEKKEKKTLLY